MSQVSLTCGLAALVVSLSLFGCSDSRNQIFDPDTGKHIRGWLPAQHATYASSGTTTMGNAIPSTAMCTECHGADLSGGISNISCSSCHLGGPTAIHPAEWFPVVLTHGPSVSTGTYTTSQCANQYCHGTALSGVAESGPSCQHCHGWPVLGSMACGWCHDIPPAGTRYPNRAGRHTAHTVITGAAPTGTGALTGCATCHNGSDGVTGVIAHYDGTVDVAILSGYNAQTGGPAQYVAASRSCNGVSCHGGLATPSWLVGSIDVNTQCTNCHRYNVAQYNSFRSGEHNKHVNGEGFACTECHDIVKLAGVHFNDLHTTGMSEAYLTIKNALQYTGSAGATGSCTLQCHGKNHNPETW